MTELIIGPMWSGKSTLMLNRLERATFAKKKVCLIRSNIDDRNFLLHSENSKHLFKKQINEIETNDLTSLCEKDIEKYDVIGIDEGQFQKHLKDFVLKYHNKQIYISALNASSEQKMFQEIIDVFPYCESITKLNAVCMECGNDTANYSKCKTKKDKDILVGSEDNYEATCFSCLKK